MDCGTNLHTYKKLNRYIALVIFLLTLALYSVTAQSSVAYWDCAEYAATSPALEIPHPPGAPVFEVITRIASLIPVVGDIAMRMNLVSALSSALAVMFLYLIGVRVIERWKRKQNGLTDAFAIYVSAAIGALALSVSDTFWFNAVESGLFATSIFFISIIVWLGMVWFDEPEREGRDKYLLLAAYLIGLSSGVHQLCLLSFFPLAVMVYFSKHEFEWNRGLKFGIGAILSFFVIYPGIVKWMIAMLSGSWSFGPISFSDSVLLRFIPPAAIAGVVYGVYKSRKAGKHLLALGMTAGLLVAAGYSSYSLIYIRANSNPPVNEGDPRTLHSLVDYLEREQYGKQPAIWPRRWNPEPKYQANYAKYSSDLDYFWSYQVDHMFLRYIGFNFIGRAGDIQDAPAVLFGTSHGWRDGEPGYPARYFAIPFLLALFGIWYNFKRDRKTALVFMTMFIIMGFALAVYFNMADPQPRERDYFFVGSFFVFALWISIGTAAIIELLANRLSGMKWKNGVLVMTIGAIFMAVPANMFRENLFTHDRHDNYAPLDISYDILQSCPKNAILFTGGDNDTFPLWYLQETRGVRTDVRVICLSLANTGWYLLQLKNDRPHGAERVAFTFSDRQIEEIASTGAIQWAKKTFRLPVPGNVYSQFGISVGGTADTGYIGYTLGPTIRSGDIGGIRVQDIMVNSIVTANRWRRPICFAITVAPGDCIGLQKYLVRQGLVYRLTPLTHDVPYYDRINVPIMRKCLFDQVDSCKANQQYGFMYRYLNKPGIYYDSNTRNMAYTIRDTFITLATYYQAHNNRTKCVTTLNAMEKKIPFRTVPSDYRLLGYVARIYYFAGDLPKFREYAAVSEKGALRAIAEDPENFSGDYNPYSILLSLYDMGKEYRKSIDLLEGLRKRFPNDPNIGARIEQLKNELKANRPAAGNVNDGG